MSLSANHTREVRRLDPRSARRLRKTPSCCLGPKDPLPISSARVRGLAQRVATPQAVDRSELRPRQILTLARPPADGDVWLTTTAAAAVLSMTQRSVRRQRRAGQDSVHSARRASLVPTHRRRVLAGARAHRAQNALPRSAGRLLALDHALTPGSCTFLAWQTKEAEARSTSHASR